MGDAGQAPRQNPEFDPSKDSSFTAEDYFVWTRVDGSTSLRQLVLMTGFDSGRAIGILRKLWACGAFLLPGETSASVAARICASAAASAAAAARDDLTPEEAAAMEEDVALSEEEKRRVIAHVRSLRETDYYALLGVSQKVTKRELKRAYFRLSKEFHPDRYYGKNVGSFGPWLASIFEAASDAFETLTDERARAAYDASLRGDQEGGKRSQQAQTPSERAREMYEEACACEIHGEVPEALRLFGEVARLDPQPRYLRRAASCAISAGELKTAEEYAKQAAHLEPRNPSSARLLARVYRAAGNLREAERTLARALELKTENDVLAAEIRADLADVRKLL